MPWVRRMLRGNKVYVRVDAAGEPAADGKGLVDIKYKASGAAKTYRAAVGNLQKSRNAADDKPIELDESAVETDRKPAAGKGSTRPRSRAKGGRGAGSRQVAQPDPPEGSIIIYTDGACTGNPGPAGLGVVIMDGDDRQEISEYLGVGTNNIAELTAIERALQAVAARRDRAIYLHSDSAYSLGLLTKNWKAKANQQLVARLRDLAGSFPNLVFVKVKGHAGVPENERADELARVAVERRR